MEIVHRLSVDLEKRKQLREFGIDLAEYADNNAQNASFVVLTLKESDSRWQQIASRIGKLHILDLVETKFSAGELEAAGALRFLSTSFSGFPEPSENSGYLKQTFDLSGYCDVCGIGLRQIAPYRMSGEPKWGKRQTTQLHWVFDDIFMRRETWQSVFEPCKIPCTPVLDRRGNPLDSVVQLRIDELSELDLGPEFAATECRQCGRRKYKPQDRGYWAKPCSIDTPVFKSRQYFGDGGEAFRDMFVSHDLYSVMARERLNCRYWACAS